MANGVPVKPARGSSVPLTSNLASGEIGHRTGTTELYINDAGTIRQLGGSGVVTKVVTHSWAIDGTIATGDLPPMIVRAPARIVGYHGVYRSGSGTVTVTLHTGSSGESDETMVGDLDTTTLKAIASEATSVSLTGTGVKYIRPIITAAGTSVADFTFAVEIEY
jgi:hypothetical protein